MNKADLRAQLSARLHTIEGRDVTRASRAIYERLIQLVDWPSVGSVHLYVAVAQWHEINLHEFILWLRKAHPTVEVTIGSPEPDAVLPEGVFDLIIVPLLGFDEKCRRLGRGRGWYDNFLAMQPHALKIGVALELQKMKAVITESHDVALDIVVTEDSIYRRQILSS